MALDSNRLKGLAFTSIYTKLKELQEPKIDAGADASQRADADQTWQDIATAASQAMIDVITEITTYGEVATTVSTNVTVASVSGVMTGAGTSGPGTGTGSGSGTGSPGSIS